METINERSFREPVKRDDLKMKSLYFPSNVTALATSYYNKGLNNSVDVNET